MYTDLPESTDEIYLITAVFTQPAVKKTASITADVKNV